MDLCEHTVANQCHRVVNFFTVDTLLESDFPHKMKDLCGKTYRYRNCGFLDVNTLLKDKISDYLGLLVKFVGTMWIYVNTLW